MDKNLTCQVLAILQARVGSTRLPGKVLMPLEDKTVIEHVIQRVKAAKLISNLVVATSTEKGDESIVALCERIGVNVYRGSEDDVLDRFYQAAKLFRPDHIVRITADCPLIDPKVIDAIIAEHFRGAADYTSNTMTPTYPDGEDVEVFKASALETAWANAHLHSEREHVTPFIKKNPGLFKLINVSHKINLSGKRWTLDEENDYIFLKNIFKCLYTHNNVFGMEDVLEFLKNNESLEKINSHIRRDEGYQKSLKNDTNTSFCQRKGER